MAGGLKAVGRRLYSGDVSFNFVGNKRRWFILSAVVLMIVIIGFAVRGLNLGIEFTGGADFQVPAHADQAMVSKVESAVAKSGVSELGDVDASKVGSKSIRVETRSLDTKTEVPKVKKAISQATGTSVKKVNYNLIGPTWGKQVTERGVIAMVVFLGLVGLLLWAYMRDLKMSGAALAALGHDLVVTIGVYALVGFTFTPESLIGMLTILGYSLYDTVVVFDKLRENTRNLTSNATRTYSEAANLAVNQTLVRSINTTVIGVLPVSALLFAGGVILHTGPLKDLSLALFVGMIAGTYSSIFLASPLLALWKEREPNMIRQHKRVLARREREAAKATGAPGGSSRAKAGSSAQTADTTSHQATGSLTVTSAEADTGEKESGDSGSGDTTPQPRRGRRARSQGSEAGQDSSAYDTARRSSLTEGGAKRPQPQHKPRSERKK